MGNEWFLEATDIFTLDTQRVCEWSVPNENRKKNNNNQNSFSINYRSGFKCAVFGKKKKMFRPHSRPVLIKWYIHLGSSVLTTLNSFNIRNSIFRPFIELDVILCAYKLL